MGVNLLQFVEDCSKDVGLEKKVGPPTMAQYKTLICTLDEVSKVNLSSYHFFEWNYLSNARKQKGKLLYFMELVI